MNDIVIRYLTPEDQMQVFQIYNHYVENSYATFDEIVPTNSEHFEKFKRYKQFGRYRCWIACYQEKIVGFCSTNQYRQHHAFNDTVEVAIYIHPIYTGKGIGKQLYKTLFSDLKYEQIHLYVSGIALPNDASIKLHKCFDFEEVGVFKEYAKKNDSYISSIWLQKIATPIIDDFQFETFNGETDKVRDLIFSILKSYGLSPDPGKTDKDIFDIENLYFKKNGWFETIYDKNRDLVGTWGLLQVDPDTVELRKMYLSEQARGNGLGKRMLERALQKAQSLGYHRVELETASVLVEAIGLYKRYGFKKTARSDLSPRCDQAYSLILS
ncbi:MAG: GNAT family N-acetyltransferase [Bdellovibrionota bacterium]